MAIYDVKGQRRGQICNIIFEFAQQ